MNGQLPPPEPPTTVRFRVLGFLCALAFVLYLDRVCIGQAARSIEEDLGLSKTLMGYVFGAFTLAYGLFEVLTGHWGDRYGSRGVLTRIVVWWSVFTVLTGCVWPFSWEFGGVVLFDSFLLLVLIRFLFGAGEAGALPNAARVLVCWFPPGRRGAAQGSITTAALIGGAAAPVLAAYVIQLAGWRVAFALFGAVGVVWAVAFYGWFHDDPADHPEVNEAERDLIRGGGPESTADGHPPVPWRRVLTSANVWLLGLAMTCNSFTSYMFLFWYPTYLQEARQVGPVWAGWLAGSVLAGGACSVIAAGHVIDRWVRRTGDRRWTRTAAGFGGLAGGALALWLSVFCDSAELAAGLTALAFFCTNVQIAAWWAVVAEISGRHLGALFGLMNSLGVPGAFLSPIFLGWFVDQQKALGYEGRDGWDPAFPLYAVLLLVGAIGWLFIDARRSAVEAPGDVMHQSGPDAH